MNWELVGAIGQLVGALAVVVSLIYLARQIRAQVQESRFAAMHDIATGYRDVVSILQANAAMREIIVKAMHGTDGLDDVERIMILSYSQLFFRLWEEAFYLNLDGRLDHRYWDGMNRQMIQFLSSPGFRYAWPRRREFYGDAFRAMVDDLLENEARENHYSVR